MMSGNAVPVLVTCKVLKLTEQKQGFELDATYLVSRKIVGGDFGRSSTIHYFYNAKVSGDAFPQYFGMWGFAALNTNLWKAKTGSLVKMTFRGKGEADEEGKTPWLCDVEIVKNDTINAGIFQKLKEDVLEFRQYIAAQGNMITDQSAALPGGDDDLPF